MLVNKKIKKNHRKRKLKLMKQDCKRSGGDMSQRHGAYFQFKQNKEEWQISEIIDNNSIDLFVLT